MGAAERRKGTAWEQAVARWLRESGTVPHAECAPRGESQNHGDIWGAPHLYIEAKNARGLDLSGWLDKAMSLAAGRLPILVIKRKGKGDTGEAYVVARLADIAPYLRDGP